MFLILLLFFYFCHKNLHIFALPSSAVLKPAQAGLVFFRMPFVRKALFLYILSNKRSFEKKMNFERNLNEKKAL